MDGCLESWAHTRGYHLQRFCRDDPVRSFEIWSPDHSKKAQIGISYLSENQVEITAFDGVRTRRKFVGVTGELSQLLDRAEAQARSWLDNG